MSGVRGPVRRSGVLGAAVALAVVGSCSLHQSGVNAPDNRIAFPAGAVVEPSGRWMYVVNSNSDLRYNAGTVVVVDLSAVRQDDPRSCAFADPAHCPMYDPPPPSAAPVWPSCPLDPRYIPPADLAGTHTPRCCWDSLDPNILDCDEQDYIPRDRSVRIGSFGGRPVLQKMPSPLGGVAQERLFVPVRGDTSITFMDVSVTQDGVNDGVSLSCTGQRPGPNPQARFATCDEHWRITRAQDPVNSTAPELPGDQVYNLPAEGYALAVDDLAQLLYVGHLRGGFISLIDLGDGQNPIQPDLVTLYQNLLPSDANGSQGVTSLTIKDKCNFGAVYAASRFLPLVGSFVVYGVAPSPGRSPVIVSRGQNISTGLSGFEARGIEFVRRQSTPATDCTRQNMHPDPEPDRLFILQRTPPALVAIDASTLTPFSVIEVCQGPTDLVQQVDPTTGGTLALFVTCFDAGEVDVIDPWVPRVRTIVPVGRGPITTVLDPHDPTRAYVVGFGGNNIAVLGLDPAIPGHDRVIQRIGFSSVTPRDTGPGQP